MLHSIKYLTAVLVSVLAVQSLAAESKYQDQFKNLSKACSQPEGFIFHKKEIEATLTKDSKSWEGKAENFVTDTKNDEYYLQAVLLIAPYLLPEDVPMRMTLMSCWTDLFELDKAIESKDKENILETGKSWKDCIQDQEKPRLPEIDAMIACVSAWK